MIVAYNTRKVFPDGSEEIRIKYNKEITIRTVKKAQRTKHVNKIKRESHKDYISAKILALKLTDRDYVRKKQELENKLNLRNLDNVFRSARRARQALYDICRCNDFDFFVTWTFDKEKVERLNDDVVKRKFTQFQNYLRKKFPQMYYVAVPEYHKEGGLHFHLLIGGVTMEELKAVPARYVKGRRKGRLVFKRGKQIFNVERWKLGYSTLSIIENGEAAKHYVCKYITKQHFDARFFNKRRYYVSANIRRPDIQKWKETIEHCLDKIDLNVYLVSYANVLKQFAVFTTDGNGIVNTSLNSDDVKADIALLRGAATQARDIAAPRDSAEYSTLRTLDSTPFANRRKKIDWNYEKNRFQRLWFKTLRDYRPPHEDFDYIKCEEQTILDKYYANMAIKPCEKTVDYEAICREIGLID